MKTNLAILALLFVTSFSASAQEPTRKDPLLDRLTGNWILQGTIAGHETTHDIESEWVLRLSISQTASVSAFAVDERCVDAAVRIRRQPNVFCASKAHQEIGTTSREPCLGHTVITKPALRTEALCVRCSHQDLPFEYQPMHERITSG